jgi:hypothetical protein
MTPWYINSQMPHAPNRTWLMCKRLYRLKCKIVLKWSQSRAENIHVKATTAWAKYQSLENRV